MLAEIQSGVRVPPAVKHPLGFICVKLYRGGGGWGLCLHIWESPAASPTLTTTPIHAHSWDLSSQVVCGRLENVEIRVADGLPEPTHRVLEVTSTGDTDVIHPTPRLVRWTRAGSAHVSAGENYRLPAGTFHLSRPSAAGPTATVLLATYRNTSPELALGRLDSRDHTVARQSCGPADLRAIADTTIREIVDHPPGGAGGMFT
jgi:hypothetical protein